MGVNIKVITERRGGMVDGEKIKEAASAAKNQNELHRNFKRLGILVAKLTVRGNEWNALILLPGERKKRYWLQ